MHRVTIERNCDDDGYVNYTAGTDDDDGLAVGVSIASVVTETVPRALLCLARAVWISGELSGGDLLPEERALVDAADACVEAWRKIDPTRYAQR